jgi:hypothetical protein
MLNARLYGFWGDLTEGLRTGQPQNERKNASQGTFEAIYGGPARLEQFIDAMIGISTPNFEAFAERFDFSRYGTLCDIGGASGRLATIVARRHPHLRCITTDLPAVTEIAKRRIAAQRTGRTRRGATARLSSADPFPRSDVITMGLILHDWNLEKKMHLIRSAYDALPKGGALVRDRGDDRRRAARAVLGLFDVAEHADRVRGRVRLHGRRISTGGARA